MWRVGLRAGLVVVFTVFAAGLLGSAQARPEANPWTGTWRMGTANWGTSWVLVQSGSSVSGTYDFCNGQIKGTTTGNKLVATWTQSFPCGGAQEGSGAVEVTMSADGTSFTGHWRYATKGGWRENDPQGTRVGPPPPTTTTTPATKLTGAAYALMKRFMTRYDKAGFSRVTDLGAVGIYRSTLAGLTLVVDPKLGALAKYDPNSKSIILSRDPRSLKPGEEDAFGQTLWHELTHAIEDAHGDIGTFDSPLYAERNIEYMTHVVGDLQTLARMEDQARRGASVGKLRQYWAQYLKQMSRANRLPETLKYPPNLKLLRTWFGFNANPAAIRKFYLSGKALPGTPGANLRKALLGP